MIIQSEKGFFRSAQKIILHVRNATTRLIDREHLSSETTPKWHLKNVQNMIFSRHEGLLEDVSNNQ